MGFGIWRVEEEMAGWGGGDPRLSGTQGRPSAVCRPVSGCMEREREVGWGWSGREARWGGPVGGVSGWVTGSPL